MSNVQSYNALIDRFKAFASGHFILKTFSHGQIDTADLEKFTEYPFMHVVPSNVSYAKGTKTFSFQIVLADLPRDKDDKVEFQREVLSDLQRIAEDLIAEITNHRVLFGDLITVQNVSLEPFLEEFHNTLTGWTISLELLVPYYWDACSIPAEWNNYFETGTGGTGSILSFNDSIVQDGNGVVTLENDLLAPPANYYYGTNGAGVRGWYLFVDQVGLTCQTIGSCQTIIDIEAAIDLLQADMLLKANSADISAVGFSNDYNDLDNKPTIPSIDGLVPYTGATGNVNLGNNDLYLAKVWLYDEPVGGFGSVHLTDGVFHVEDTEGHSMVTFEDGFFTIANGALIRALFNISGLTANRDYVFPNTSGTVALTSDIPAAQVNSDWNATSGVSKILNKPTLTNGTVTSVGVTAGTGISVSGSPITSSGSITVTNSAPDQVVAISAGMGIGVTGTYPNFTVTNSAPSSGGTVTSVSALTLGTTGTDLSSTVANSTSTPVITLNVPTASAANRGALSATDWTTFNGKQAALVSGTNIKTINSTSLLGSGNITVGTFTLPSLTSGSVLFSDGTTIAQNNANFFWDNTNSRLGIGTASPTTGLTISKALTTTGNELFNINYTHNSYSSGQIQLGQYFNNTRINFIHGANNTAMYLGGANFTIETQNVGNFILSNGTERMRMVATTGNILIGTTTDAGYKLDVNGTARVALKLSVGTPSAASALMEVTSTTLGFLPPRMTTTQKNAIASPSSGLVVYDTTLNKLCVRGAAAWETITSI
jgi:hypothetical protein